MRKGMALLSAFWFGAAMGAAALALALLAITSYPGAPSTTPDDLLYHYQTLFAGTGAVIAAVVTVWVIWKQIEQQYELEEERRQRQGAATRSALPAALSALCQYAEDCVRWLEEMRDYRTKEQIMYPETDTPKFVTVPPKMLDGLPNAPTSLVSTISRCVEFADELPAKELWALSANLQIQNSRCHTLRRRDALPIAANGLQRILVHQLDSLILDSVELYARASNLFDFGRGTYSEEDFKPNREAMTNALSVCRLSDDEHKYVWDSVQRNYPE